MATSSVRPRGSAAIRPRSELRSSLQEKKTLIRLTGMRVFLFIAVTALTAFAQDLKFDAASVLPNNLDDRIVRIDPGTGGRFSARGYSLKLLIQHAWGVKGFQISGGPSWLDEDRWDVTARGPATSTPEQMKLMVQALLNERFALRIHTVTQEMPGYELNVDGRSKMKISEAKQANDNVTRNAAGALEAHGMSMPAFVKILGAYLAKPVLDNTGLTGLYDFTLIWNARFDVIPDVASGGDLTGVTLPAALRDQLGLKVTLKRGVPAEVIVIDSAQKASAN